MDRARTRRTRGEEEDQEGPSPVLVPVLEGDRKAQGRQEEAGRHRRTFRRTVCSQ